MSDKNIVAPNPAIPMTAVVGVDVEGRAAWWDGQSFHGDRQIVGAAHYACTIERDMEVGFRTVVARSTTPDGAIAALFAFKPGRTRIDFAPEGLAEWLFEA